MPLARHLFAFALLLLAPLGVLASSAGEEPGPARDFEYIEMLPAFVVNIGSSGRIAFLKTEVSLRASAQAAPLVRHHMPALRHEMIMLLGRESTESLASSERREALRTEALQTLRQVLADAGPAPGAGDEDADDEGHAPPGEGHAEDAIQDLMFTSFITQR